MFDTVLNAPLLWKLKTNQVAKSAEFFGNIFEKSAPWDLVQILQQFCNTLFNFSEQLK